MIVSDATALIVLINIDEFRVLELFSESITLPQEVYDEVCKKEHAKQYMDAKIKQGFITLCHYEDKQTYKEINFILDAGESAAITLAIEKKMPLIIDEKKGRQFAQMQGVEIIGLVGIMKFLFDEKRLRREEVILLKEKLERSDFRISDTLLEWIVA
ncbi:MAG: hypothetical protein U9O64_11555 [Campylobacterota bacterium]|nr:hypothetical protein [Campylobacterota bacterium]